ncbi:hypothetical protein LCGC14_1497420 [marine sediment metagenome]|uniref:Uncharacterized protein n=1 Tax=marine sediment metagenome TaxID=412755 RepID=A0A0F9J5P2_9ZZZZ
MKEFKRWLKEDSIKSGYLYDEEAERQREKGWRGALKWVLSKETVKPLLGCKEHRYIDSRAIRNELQKK